MSVSHIVCLLKSLLVPPNCMHRASHFHISISLLSSLYLTKASSMRSKQEEKRMLRKYRQHYNRVSIKQLRWDKIKRHINKVIKMFSKSVLKLQSCDLRTSCEEFRSQPVTAHCCSPSHRTNQNNGNCFFPNQPIMSVGGLTIKKFPQW